jgi:hypothetical protein
MSLEIQKSGDKYTVTYTGQLLGSMMDMEDQILKAVNEIGSGLTELALNKFDPGGEPLKIGDTKFTVQQKTAKDYQTPYATVRISRHVYQTSKGGKTYCPLDSNARIIGSSTPRFANMVTSKYANQCARGVQGDLELSNGRKVSCAYIQDMAETVGTMANAVEETMDYEIPELKDTVSTIAFSLDGTCMLMKNDGYREAMTGTLSLYDAAGERLHTIYLGAAPEHGKEAFLAKLALEIEKIKSQFPEATYVGIADGAQCNWKFLEQYATIHILDFYHATEYLTGASEAFGKGPGERKAWLTSACHNLKHDANGARTLLKEMKKRRKLMPFHEKSTPAILEKLDKAITYFTNQMKRMSYAEYRAKNFPIGSGVTEAACKTLIKQRLCNSGMKWKNRGAQIVISLRAIVRTKGRWTQFWEKINTQGLAGVLMK